MLCEIVMAKIVTADLKGASPPQLVVISAASEPYRPCWRVVRRAKCALLKPRVLINVFKHCQK